MQTTKRNKEILKSVNVEKEYTLPEAISILKDQSKVKFVESLDCAIRLGVDPRHADQMVRGTVSLPHGTGKTVKVLVIAKGAKIQEALDAGADHAGFDDYLEKINFNGKHIRIDKNENPTQMILQARFGSELWRYFVLIAILLALVEMTIARNAKKEMEGLGG